MTATTTATLADLLADLHRPGEHVAVCHAAPGGRFTARVVPAEDAAQVADELPPTVNVWYSVNPVSPRTTGRGTAEDVTRWAALYADLDVKPGALPDLDAGRAVITDLAVMLNAEPAYVTLSGHGLQPVWLLDAEDDDAHLDTEAKRTRAQALLRRWGRLVARVTADRGSGDVDSVYDLPRVLRAPGSVNVKYPEHPVPVTCEARGGRPLTVAEVAETLAAYGVTEQPEDTESVGAVIAPPAEWQWGAQTCPWVVAMVRGWQTDTPKARHPWLTGMAVKLAAARRAGCITEADHRAAWDTLAARFRHLLATTDPVRREAPREIADASAWATAKAASLTDERVAAELGNHRHPAPEMDLPAVTTLPAEVGSILPTLDDGQDDDPGAVVRRRFPRLDLANLLRPDRPPRPWVVHGLIPAGAAVSIVAPAGTGKSLLLLALVLDIVRGRRAFAGLTIPRRRRVLLVDMENTEDDLAERLTALGIAATDVPDLGDLIPIHLPPLAPLDTVTGGMELEAILDAYHVGPEDVVVLDSFQRVTDGPENDSDTYRAYYRHTGMLLKRRGVTVIRTDNTGKDTEKGARGSSGKRDDVDLELLLTRDAQLRERFYIKPGKVRLPGITSLTIESHVDDDGHLTYTTAGDPWRAKVDDAHRALDAADVPRDAGERKAAEMVKAAGLKVTRAALRTAIKERRDAPDLPGMTAPPPGGAPPAEDTPADRADHARRTNGAPPADPEETAEYQRKHRADDGRRTGGAVSPGAPPPGAPPLPLSKERRARAHHAEKECQRHPGTPVSDGAGCPRCAWEGRYTS